jgi:hypothetical protein
VADSQVILQPADVLCWRVMAGTSWFERLIGWGERRLGDQTGPAAFYHCAFVAQDTTKMYASKPPKIDLYPIPNSLPSYIEVHRLKVPPSSAQLQAIFAYAESRRGKWYPILGVLTAGWLSGNLEFCSQYTEDSFADGQIVLAPNIRFTTPDDIAASPLLLKV